MPEPEIYIEDKGHYAHHRLMLDGKQVSDLEVIDYTMRVGITQVRMGGIGGVGTDSEHRNKGYARRVLENSTRWMADNGFDCATLFGISDFYDKFGYAPCLPESKYTILTRQAERAEPMLTMRPFAPDDLPALREIYAANNADLTGSIVRQENTHWFRKGSNYDVKADPVVFTTPDNTIAAYAARDKNSEEVIVCEFGAREAKHYADILRWAANCAVEQRCETIEFLGPPDSLFNTWVTQFSGKHLTEFWRCANGMGRIIALASFLEKTLPEWTRRANTSRDIAPGASLRLETDIGAVRLRWTGETMEMDNAQAASATIRLPQYRLMQFAMGYFGADVAPAFSEIEMQGDVRLFTTLFPRRLPYMWTTDHF